MPDTTLRPPDSDEPVQEELVPGSDRYWRRRRDAFAFILRLQRAIRERNRAPMYIAGPGYDPEDGHDDVIENLGPWDLVAGLRNEAEANPTVMEILAAQRRLSLLDDRGVGA